MDIHIIPRFCVKVGNLYGCEKVQAENLNLLTFTAEMFTGSIVLMRQFLNFSYERLQGIVL